jgi:hypothetical protein
MNALRTIVLHESISVFVMNENNHLLVLSYTFVSTILIVLNSIHPINNVIAISNRCKLQTMTIFLWCNHCPSDCALLVSNYFNWITHNWLPWIMLSLLSNPSLFSSITSNQPMFISSWLLTWNHSSISKYFPSDCNVYFNNEGNETLTQLTSMYHAMSTINSLLH